MVSYAFVDGFTREPREEAIARLKHAIAAVSGVISDFAFYGREAIRLTVEVDAAGLGQLRRELDTSGVEVFPRSAAALDGALTMSPKRPLLAMLHIALLGEPADPAEPLAEAG
jgi:hypothetical protein